jgi:RimJ/RimL family protein N-acetyltransferase
MTIDTTRLVLRPWTDRDRRPFAEMCDDPAFIEYLMPFASREASNVWIDRQMAHLAAHGFCFWAVEAKENAGFVGTVGLLRIGYEAHFPPAVEIGWRVSRAFWGLGYAPEAAMASIRFGFDTLQLSEIVANTPLGNGKSRRVMSKLGMSHDASDDFGHPLVPKGHPLRRQVLYRLPRYG